MKERTIYRLPPCSAMDIERLESWLTDMAADGWHLLDVGRLWLARPFRFRKGEPKTVRYRLEPKGGWNEDKLDYHTKEFFKDMGWEVVSDYEQFLIFCATSADAPELNTDPAIQLIALKKLRRGTVIGNLISLALIPFLVAWWSRALEPFRFLITFGMTVAILVALAFCYGIVDMILQMVQANAIVKKLKNGEELDHRKPWRKGGWYHRIGALATCIFYLFYLLSLLTQCTNATMHMGTSLADYKGDPPFVTIQDLYPEGKYVSSNIVGAYDRFTKYGSDCAPLSVEWYEYAEVTVGKEAYEGALIVHYHETVAPWIARGLAKEYYRVALEEKYNHEIEAPELDADFVGVYTMSGMPTLILQKGNVVVTAFVGVEQDGEYVMLQWAEMMLQMLDE